MLVSLCSYVWHHFAYCFLNRIISNSLEMSLHFLILKFTRSLVSLHAKQTTKKPLDEVNKPQRVLQDIYHNWPRKKLCNWVLKYIYIFNSWVLLGLYKRLIERLGKVILDMRAWFSYLCSIKRGIIWKQVFLNSFIDLGSLSCSKGLQQFAIFVEMEQRHNL